MVKDAPDLSLEILDHILMAHAQDLAGQGRVPVRHQLEVGPVVTRDVLDAVGELLALREQLLEDAETTAHRLAGGRR